MNMIVAMLLALSLAQDDEKPYVPKHKIEFKLSLIEERGAWKFSVEGTTDLRDDVVLMVRVYAMEEVDDYKGGRKWDEQALSIREEMRWHRFTLKDGKFKEMVFECKRRPFSLPYRARVEYRPEEQHEALAREIGEQRFSFPADLRRGAPADFERELKESSAELARDMEEIQVLFRDFKTHFLEQQKKADAKAWSEFRDKWLVLVKAVADRNDERWQLWCVWLERQGKFRIEGFCDRFTQMAEQCTEALTSEADALARLQKSFEYFLIYYDEAREVMGIDTPFNPEAVGAQVAEYEDAATRLKATLGDSATWLKESERVRSKARAAILALSNQKLVPRRGYERIVALSELFMKLCDCAEKGDAAAAKPLVKDHDERLAEFKKYAGLK